MTSKEAEQTLSLIRTLMERSTCYTNLSGHAGIAAELAETPGLRSDDVPDLEIAALAIEHGLVLASHDHGFRRFSRLRVVDPLMGGVT